jgi:hypothetical protein
MRITRLITTSFAAALAAAALAVTGHAMAADAHGRSNVKPAATLSTTTLPGPPTWPVDPQPIAHAGTPVEAPGSGLDWLSAFIGAAAAGLLAIAVAALLGLRRRRIARPGSLTTH